MTDTNPAPAQPTKPPPSKRDAAIGCGLLLVVGFFAVPMCMGKKDDKKALRPLAAKVADFPAEIPILRKAEPKLTLDDGVARHRWSKVSLIGSSNFLIVEDLGNDGVADTAYVGVTFVVDQNQMYLESAMLSLKTIEVATGEKIPGDEFGKWLIDILETGKGERQVGGYKVSAFKAPADRAAALFFSINEPPDKDKIERPQP